MLFTVSFDMG